ncbi:hypothetical protein [Chitinophaga sp. YR573]|uniref:hypothetical protein n=1 Tax=Chitinophaga sp. YR573 TaxID=1881040 RepID=UPI00115F8269|nr:hypothetical protein [Chitinophaga sp. YR573]
MLKKDHLGLGIVLGLLTPFVTFFIYYLLAVYMPYHRGLSEFVQILLSNRQMLPKIISICLLFNGAVFYIYTRQRKDLTAKGIFLVTMLYAITIILLKLLHG